MSTALTTIAQSTGVTPDEVSEVLRGMIISGKGQHGATATNAEMTVVSSIFAKYDLNPFVREGHAFVSGGKLQVVIGLDGWLKIMIRQHDFDGFEQEDTFDANGEMVSVTTKIYVKNRKYPSQHTEYMDEAYVATSPAWKKFKKRMLSGKSLGQCVRKTFGIAELIDDDEKNRITGNKPERDITPQPSVDMSAIAEQMKACDTLDKLDYCCMKIGDELRANGSFESVKPKLILLKHEHQERINSEQNDDIEVDFDTGEILDGEVE